MTETCCIFQKPLWSIANSYSYSCHASAECFVCNSPEAYGSIIVYPPSHHPQQYMLLFLIFIAVYPLLYIFTCIILPNTRNNSIKQVVVQDSCSITQSCPDLCDSMSGITNSWRLFKLMSIKLVMSSNYLILCHPLLLLPSVFPRIRVFSNESVFASGGQSIVAQHQSFQ